MKRILDPNVLPKQLWRNLDVVGAKVIILFFTYHSTCSVLLKITNDLLMALEAKCMSVM
jgi:hypothetical protein